jgi:hypothetical protein
MVARWEGVRSGGETREAQPPHEAAPARRQGAFVSTYLKQQHAIPVREKAIPLPNGMSIGSEHPLPTLFRINKGANQHQQRRLRKMKVSKQATDDLKLIPRAKKNTGFAGVGSERLTVSDPGTVFESARGGGSGSDDSAAFTLGEVDGGGGLGRESVVLGVKTDVGEKLCADGLEGSEADVKGDGFDLHALLPELIEDRGREVKPGGGGRGGTGVLGEDGLVAGLIFRRVGDGFGAVDVGRERHVADAIQDLVEVGRWREAEGAFAELACGEDFGFEHGRAVGDGFIAEEETFAGLDLAARTD